MSSPVSLSDLPDFLQRQRWFGGKAWPLKSAEVLDYVVVGEDVDPHYVLAVIEVTYEVGHPERYVLSVNERGASLEEALGRDETVQSLFRMIRGAERRPSASGELFGEPTPGADFPGDDTPAVRRLAVDQTNTSVVLDEDVILKVIRKLEPGVNPEVEIGRILTEKTSFRSMPELLGALQLDSQGPMTIAVLHRFVKDAIDGWKHVTGRLERGDAQAELDGELLALGTLVGELHVALASVEDEPGFTPEPVLGDDLQRWSSSVVGELGVTLAQAQGADPSLESHRERLVEKVRELAHAQPSGQRIRVHGDLHLGQVLRTEGRWLVFDFEGEPRRTFAQRREKTSPLKDVAGMLRSLDYASAAVKLEGAAREAFLGAARGAFLKGYRRATRGAAFLPDDPATMSVMLRVFELEKLLYELRYELANRPDWVHIPLAALKRDEGPVPDDS